MDTDKTTTKEVPTVDKDAPLEIEKITKSSDVPTVDKNASLKVDETKEEQEEVPQEKSNQKLFIAGGVILGVIILATVGFLVFFSREPQEEQNVISQVDSSPPAVAEVSKKTLNRSDWNLEVLNGSGIAGAAKKAADKLTALGYQVVKTGNANKQTYEGNQLIVSQGMEGEKDLLIADLKDIIKIATVAATLKDSTASAQIVIGKE